MSVNAETLERIKNQLKDVKNVGNNVSQDLYSHLTEVFNRILLHHPYDAYDKFEEISALVKKTHLKFQDPKYDFEVNAEHGAAAQTAKDQWVQKSKNLINEVSRQTRISDICDYLCIILMIIQRRRSIDNETIPTFVHCN